MSFPTAFSYVPWGHHINVRIKEIQAQLPTTEQIKAVIEQAEQDFLRDKKDKN